MSSAWRVMKSPEIHPRLNPSGQNGPSQNVYTLFSMRGSENVYSKGPRMRKPYESPKVFELGTVEALTQNTPKVDKCSGGNDVAFPQILSSNFSFDCD